MFYVANCDFFKSCRCSPIDGSTDFEEIFSNESIFLAKEDPHDQPTNRRLSNAIELGIDTESTTYVRRFAAGRCKSNQQPCVIH